MVQLLSLLWPFPRPSRGGAGGPLKRRSLRGGGVARYGHPPLGGASRHRSCRRGGMALHRRSSWLQLDQHHSGYTTSSRILKHPGDLPCGLMCPVAVSAGERPPMPLAAPAAASKAEAQGEAGDAGSTRAVGAHQARGRSLAPAPTPDHCSPPCRASR